MSSEAAGEDAEMTDTTPATTAAPPAEASSDAMETTNAAESEAAPPSMSILRDTLNGCWSLDKSRGEWSMRHYLEVMGVNELGKYIVFLFGETWHLIEYLTAVFCTDSHQSTWKRRVGIWDVSYHWLDGWVTRRRATRSCQNCQAESRQCRFGGGCAVGPRTNWVFATGRSGKENLGHFGQLWQAFKNYVQFAHHEWIGTRGGWKTIGPTRRGSQRCQQFVVHDSTNLDHYQSSNGTIPHHHSILCTVRQDTTSFGMIIHKATTKIETCTRPCIAQLELDGPRHDGPLPYGCKCLLFGLRDNPHPPHYCRVKLKVKDIATRQNERTSERQLICNAACTYFLQMCMARTTMYRNEYASVSFFLNRNHNKSP